MQNLYPPDRVLVSERVPCMFQVSPNDMYIDIYTQQERDAIIQKYKTPNLFNGSCVRLDRIVGDVAYLSPVWFYDFLCCNIVGFHNKDPLAWSKLDLHLKKYGKLNSFEKVLEVNELPNIIGVSTLLHDINNEYLLVERNTSVSVGSGLFACTSSGSLDVDDMQYDNPIVGCGLRELEEELNMRCQLYLTGLVIPVQKMQPIALLTGTIGVPFRQILPQMKQGIDFNKENTRVLLVPKEKLLPMISTYSFTDAAAYQIFTEAGGNKKLWKSVEFDIVRLTDYYA